MINRTLLFFFFITTQSYALESMTDDDLRNTSGQALLSINHIAPSALGNPSSTIGFYKMSLQAQLEINANIAKMQLGCRVVGGVNGCDIDVDRMRLTGINPGSDGEYASSDAVLTNPFFEFAIANPNTAANREIVGVRFGAENVLGLLSVGENPDTSQPNEVGEFGVNSFSGGFTSVVSDITIPVSVCSLGVNASRSGCAGLGSVVVATGTTFINPAPYVKRASGTRMTSILLDNIPLSGTVGGLNVNISSDLTENLKNVHQMAMNNTKDFFLSVQKQNVLWRQEGSGTWTQANQGWWMEVPQVEIKNFTSQRVFLSSLEAVGGTVGIDVALNSIDMGQVPIDNCYGGLSFC